MPTTRIPANATDEGRTCTSCATHKPWAEFSKKKRGLNGHHAQCKSCESSYSARRWAAADPETRDRSYAANRAWIAANRDRRRAYLRAWDRSSRGRESQSFRNARRRAKLRGNPSEPYDASDLAFLLEEAHDFRCAYCGGGLDGEVHWDHVQPIHLGGADAIWNLAPSCRPCNSSKWAHPLETWLPRHLALQP